MLPIFKTLKTYNKYYVYDRNCNAIISVKKPEYEELQKVEKGILEPEDSQTIKYYQKKGYLKNNQVTEIEHPSTCYVDYLISHNVEQVTLQVTQRCNLRCSYCIYSGKHENRTHSTLDMSFEQAKNIIDFGLKRSNESKVFLIGFYGGEPLLNFDLIKQCVYYVENVARDRKIQFSMTTNGTLLTLDKVEYLYEKNFDILVSLDGSKEEHNLNRVFQNGMGSFDIIMDNLTKIKSMFPDYFEKITYNCVVNPNHNFEHIKRYFDNYSIIGRSNVMYQAVDLPDNEKVNLADSYYQIQAFEYLKMLLYMIEKLPSESVAPYMWSSAENLMKTYDKLNMHSELIGKYHHSGPCIPGMRRPFFNCQGNIYPCERVSELSGIMKIGSLDKGYDTDKVKSLLNIGKVTEDKCLHCWALLYCVQCAKDADGVDHISRTEKLKHCSNSRYEAEDELLEMCVLKEFNCKFDVRERNYE